MKHLFFLFYILIGCSSFTGYNGYAGENTFRATEAFPPQDDGPVTFILDCHDGCPEPLLMGKIPTKPGCSGGNCTPDYIYRRGNAYILVYKSAGRAQRVSVTLEVKKVSAAFLTMLNASKDGKVFLNSTGALLKGKELRMSTLQ